MRLVLLAALAAAVLPPGGARAETVARDPAWSPDGNSIAFVIGRESFLSTDVWIMATDGGRQRNLTSDRRRDENPRWSHDGRLIAYGSYHPRDGSELRLVPTDGGAPRVVSEIAAEGYDWSPVERRLAYAGRDGEIRLVDVDAGSTRALVAGTAPAWSPDGRTLAFVRDGSIWLVAADGGEARRLTSGPRDTGGRWSPDGRSIAFTTGRHGSFGNAEIYVVDVHSEVERRLTFNEAVLADFKGSALDFEPAWSPDGRELAFTSGRGARFDLWAIGPDGRGLRRITDTRGTHEEQHAAWSPDGQRIAFEIQRPYWSFDDDIGVAGRDGRGRHNLTFTPRLVVVADPPRFSRDGRWLVARVRVADSAATRRRGARVTVRGDGIAPKTRRTNRAGFAVFLLRVPRRGEITLIIEARAGAMRGRLVELARDAIP